MVVDINATKLKSTLQKCRITLHSNISNLRESVRVTKEIDGLEKDVKKLKAESESAHKLLSEQEAVVEDLKPEVNELRDLLDSSRRWNEDANRIASKRIKISQKRVALSVSTPYHDRDLRTVERDVTRLGDEKDKYANRINELNRQMTSLNRALHEATEKVS
jgi:predicted  nucleic acid-binding Zn-ribbon protein